MSDSTADANANAAAPDDALTASGGVASAVDINDLIAASKGDIGVADDISDLLAASKIEPDGDNAVPVDISAAAWGEAEATDAMPDYALSQSEIDNLFGFDDKSSSQSLSGMQRIISPGIVSYERLPMLEIVLDRLVRIMTISLRNFTNTNVEVSIDNIFSLRFGDYLNSIPLPALLAVFKADQWDNHALMVIDSALLYSMVDVLLGGGRNKVEIRIEGRPYTTIEQSLTKRLIEVVLQDLSTSFEPLSPVNFRFERLEVNPRFAAISRPSNAAVRVGLRVDMEDCGGRIELLLPYTTLEPVRGLLLQQFMGEKFGRDFTWETHFAEELRNTDVELDAVLDEQVVRLADVMQLRVGDSIPLTVQAGAPVKIRCGGTALFEGHLGQRKNHVAIRLETKLSPHVEAGA